MQTMSRPAGGFAPSGQDKQYFFLQSGLILQHLACPDQAVYVHRLSWAWTVCICHKEDFFIMWLIYLYITP